MAPIAVGCGIGILIDKFAVGPIVKAYDLGQVGIDILTAVGLVLCVMGVAKAIIERL